MTAPDYVYRRPREGSASIQEEPHRRSDRIPKSKGTAMVSRRDELLSSLDTAFNQLRTSFGGGVTHTSQPTTVSSTPTIPAFARHGFSSTSSRHRFPSETSGGPPAGGGVAVNRALDDGGSVGGDALPTYQEARRAPRPEMGRRRTSSTNSVSRLAASNAAAAAAASGPAPAPSGPVSTFTFRSGSGKVMLRLYAPTGRRADGAAKVPVLVQGHDREIRGEVTVDLGSQGEPVSEIRVKCKGVVKTLVIKTKGSGSSSRIPVVDENVFLQSDRTLYVPAAGVPADFRLTGAHSWSFTFTLPPSVPSFSHPSAPSTPIPLPPSFALTSSVDSLPPSGLADRAAGLLNGAGGAADGGITEWASVKYYLKLTIAKKGLLRLNERLFAPFVLLSAPFPPVASGGTPPSTPGVRPGRNASFSSSLRSSTPPLSPSVSFPNYGPYFSGGQKPTWAEALDSGRPPMGPAEDPGSWTGRKVRKELGAGAFGGGGVGSLIGRGSKKTEGWYEMISLLPTPPVFNRRQPLPYYLKITASDPHALEDFPISIVDVVIIQRVTLNASGVTGVHENPIGRGTTVPDGPRDGVVATRHEWIKKLKGEVKLDAGAVPNFFCPNINVEYFFVATVRSNQGNGAQCVLPVKLVSSARKRSASVSQPNASTSGRPGVPPSPSSSPAPGGAAGTPMGTETEVDLPPSYFEVQEMDRRRGGGRDR